MRVRLFTHKADLDGWSCSVVASVYFSDVVTSYHHYTDIDQKFMEFLHSNELNDFHYIFITDLSLSEETAERVDGYLKSGRVMPQIILLDHHASAERLNKYDWCTVHVTEYNQVTKRNEPTCGTMLLNDWCAMNIEFVRDTFGESYSKSSLQCFVENVRDWDTWEWKNNPNSWGETAKELNDLFFIYPRGEFVQWCLDKIIGNGRSFLAGWSDTEQLLLDNKKNDFENYYKAKNASIKTYHGFGYVIGVVFADRYISELGNKLGEEHPEFDVITLINLSLGTVSFRTVKDEVDVSKLAERLGGGGHVKASGTTVTEDFVLDMIDDLFMELELESKEF